MKKEAGLVLVCDGAWMPALMPAASLHAHHIGRHDAKRPEFTASTETLKTSMPLKKEAKLRSAFKS